MDLLRECPSESKNTSPLIDESSEHSECWGCCKWLDSRNSQLLGVKCGTLGEFDGVDVLGILEGVNVITEGLDWSGIKTKLSRTLFVWFARIGTKVCLPNCPSWHRLSLLNRPLALDRSKAAAISWQDEAELLFEFSLQRFLREVSSCSAFGSSSQSNLLL